MSEWQDGLHIADAVQQKYIGYSEVINLSELGVFLAGIIDAREEFLVKRTKPDYSILVYTLEGTGELLTPNETLPITPNTISILPAFSISGLNLTSERWQFAWVSLKAEGRWANLANRAVSVNKSDYVPSIYHMMSSLYHELVREPSAKNHHLTQAEVVLGLIEESVQDLSQTPPLEQRLKQVFAQVEQQLHKAWSVQDIAALMYCSEAHLHRLCLKYLGSSPKQYLLSLRMEKARQLLTFGHYQVHQVAFSVGYQDTSSFSNRFKKYFGISPSELYSDSRQYKS